MTEEEKSRTTTTTDKDKKEILNESSGSTGTQDEQDVPKSEPSLDTPL